MFDGEPPETAAALRRYWLLTTEPPGFSGGIGVYTHQSARMLADRGVAVTVLHHDAATADPVCGFRDGYRLIRFSARGLDRRPIPHANLHGPLRAAREAGEMVRQLIDAEGAPDVVEFPDYGALAHGFLKHRLMHAETDWPRVVLTAHRPHLHCVLTDEDNPTSTPPPSWARRNGGATPPPTRSSRPAASSWSRWPPSASSTRSPPPPR